MFAAADAAANAAAAAGNEVPADIASHGVPCAARDAASILTLLIKSLSWSVGRETRHAHLGLHGKGVDASRPYKYSICTDRGSRRRRGEERKRESSVASWNLRSCMEWKEG